ncbi:MAG: hypothetical protein Q7S59_07095, partial [Sulfurimonas sp.]|nr:hypothetical protein [Sulfurimonas sp.]
INGTAVDGYISGANICLDLDSNGICSATESKTTTAIDGTFSFSNIEKGANSYGTVILTGGTDTATNKELDEELKNIIDTKNVHSTILITPLNDLTAISFLDSSVKNSTKLNDSREMIESGLSLSQTDLDKDPMQDIKMFFKVQDLQYIKKIVQNVTITSLAQDINVTKKQEIDYKIKKALLTPIEEKKWDTLDLYIVLSVMEAQTGAHISTEAKEFVAKNLNQFRDSLKVLSVDSRLTVNMLSRLQVLLEIQRDTSITAINSKDYNATIKPIDLNITIDKIAQTDFNTTDAIYDGEACLDNSTNNVIDNTSFIPDSTADTTNGVYIKSNIGFNTQIEKTVVQLFYPNLSVGKTGVKTMFIGNKYYLEFDNAWVSNSDNKVYIQTPSSDSNLSECYKLNLSSINANVLTTTKVFRYSGSLF